MRVTLLLSFYSQPVSYSNGINNTFLSILSLFPLITLSLSYSLSFFPLPSSLSFI